MGGPMKKKKGMKMGGAMKKKGMKRGGPMKKKGMKKGGASMTLAKVRSAANKMGYKLTKK